MECHLPPGRSGTCPCCTCLVLPRGGPPVRPSRRTPCPCRVPLSCRGGGHPAVWAAHRWPVWLSMVGSFLRSGFSSSIPSSDSSDTLGWSLSLNFDYSLKINAWIWKTLIGTEHVDLVWTQHVWSCSVLQIRYKLEQSSFSTNWSIVQLSTKMHFRKLDQTFQLSTKILLNFSFFQKIFKKLGSFRPKILYEIDRTLCGEHSQVNL